MKKKFLLTILLSVLSTMPVVYANSRIDIKIENSRFLGGLNLTDGRLAAGLSVDWSQASGLFAGIDCYASNALEDQSLANGCLGYAGQFLTFAGKSGREQALALSVRHFILPELRNRNADFSEAAVDWHINRNAVLSFSGSDSWLGRGFNTWSLDAKIRKNISENVDAIFSAGVIRLESDAPVNSIESASLGIAYRFKQWVAEAKLLHVDDDLSVMTGFEVNQPELSISLSYQLY